MGPRGLSPYRVTFPTPNATPHSVLSFHFPIPLLDNATPHGLRGGRYTSGRGDTDFYRAYFSVRKSVAAWRTPRILRIGKSP
jgi:hypothetical protein